MTPDKAGIVIANRFVSGAYTGRDNLAVHISSAIKQARSEALEEAARVAESMMDELCNFPIMDYVGAAEERNAQLSALNSCATAIRALNSPARGGSG